MAISRLESDVGSGSPRVSHVVHKWPSPDRRVIATSGEKRQTRERLRRYRRGAIVFAMPRCPADGEAVDDRLPLNPIVFSNLDRRIIGEVIISIGVQRCDVGIATIDWELTQNLLVDDRGVRPRQCFLELFLDILDRQSLQREQLCIKETPVMTAGHATTDAIQRLNLRPTDDVRLHYFTTARPELDPRTIWRVRHRFLDALTHRCDEVAVADDRLLHDLLFAVRAHARELLR